MNNPNPKVNSNIKHHNNEDSLIRLEKMIGQILIANNGRPNQLQNPPRSQYRNRSIIIDDNQRMKWNKNIIDHCNKMIFHGKREDNWVSHLA